MEIQIPKCKICKLYVQLGEIILYVCCDGGHFCHKRCNEKRGCSHKCFVCLGVCVPLELKIYDAYGAIYHEAELKRTIENLNQTQTQLVKVKSDYIKLESKFFTLEKSNKRIEDECLDFERKYTEAMETKKSLDKLIKRLNIETQKKNKELKALSDRVEELQKEAGNKTKMS